MVDQQNFSDIQEQTKQILETFNSGSLPQKINIDQMASYESSQSSSWSGDKFVGGFGLTKDYDIVDYDLIRTRSKQLFTENLYAKGLIKRLITNEINKGLALESTPDAEILSIKADTLADWSENTERRFNIWGKNPEISDYKGLETFGKKQRQARMMAIISGDVLVLLRQGITGLPLVDLIDADHVENPQTDKQLRAVTSRGNTVEHGVELDAAGRHIAFFIRQSNGTHKRVTAKGSKTGRKQAWLLYGSEKLLDDVRGQSLLAVVIQSLKEIDRYRDAEQRAAVINSMIAMWVKKTDDKPGTLPMGGGATRKDSVETQNDSQGRKDVQFSSNLPGMVMQELQTGEEPVSYDTRRPNVNFGVFETATLSAIAWSHEMPPETLFLQFQNNYSASRGATNEFKMYLERARTGFGEEFNAPIYQDWLLSEILLNNISADGFLDAWANINEWDILGAWILSDWAGAIKPNVDLLKEVRAYMELVNSGWITRDRAARELTGMKYSKVVQQLVRENEDLGKALQPLINTGLIKDQNADTEETDIDEEN